jgi:phosphohistidine swiveling domain-containing protein
MTKNDRANTNTNGATTQRIERDEAAVQTTVAHEDEEVVWKAMDDLVQRYEREDAEAAAATRRARAAVAAEPAKLFREIVLSVARILVAYRVDEHVVRHLSRSLARLYKRRVARLQGAHETLRVHEAHEAMGEIEAEEIVPVPRPAHVGSPSSYPSAEDLAVGLER